MASLNMANREVCNLVFVDYITDEPFLNVDYANVTTTELTGESVYAYGGWGHPKRITFFGERGGTIAFETQIQPFKLYSMLTGGDIGTEGTWLQREEVTCTTGGQISISDNAATTVNVFAASDDCGTKIPGTLSSGTFTATSDGSIVVGTKYIAYYTKSLSGIQKLSVNSTTFPKYFKAYMETKYKTEDGNDVLYRMVAYKCAPQIEFSLEMSNEGDPATLTVTCDLMLDDNKNMLDMMVVDED